jgi:hypothetical protein
MVEAGVRKGLGEQVAEPVGPVCDAGLGCHKVLADLEQHVGQAAQFGMDRDGIVLVERHWIGLVVADGERSVGAQGRKRKRGEAAVEPVMHADVPGPGAAEVDRREGMERDHHGREIMPHPGFHELMDRIMVGPVECRGAHRLLRLRQREIAGHVDVLAAGAEG